MSLSDAAQSSYVRWWPCSSASTFLVSVLSAVYFDRVPACAYAKFDSVARRRNRGNSWAVTIETVSELA